MIWYLTGLFSFIKSRPLCLKFKTSNKSILNKKQEKWVYLRSILLSCELIALTTALTEGKNQALVGSIQYCGEYSGPRFEDKFRSANQVDGISEAGEVK